MLFQARTNNNIVDPGSVNPDPDPGFFLPGSGTRIRTTEQIDLGSAILGIIKILVLYSVSKMPRRFYLMANGLVMNYGST